MPISDAMAILSVVFPLAWMLADMSRSKPLPVPCMVGISLALLAGAYLLRG